MLRRILVLLSLLALALSVQAREQASFRSEPPAPAVVDGANKFHPESEADLAQAEQINRQKRRDVLREALRGQSEEAQAPAALRQMSLQQRLELRQQLRQQQEWLK